MVHSDRRETHKTDELITPFHSVLVKVATKPNGNEELFIILIVAFFAIFTKFIRIRLIFDFYALTIKEGLLVVSGCSSEKLFRATSEWIPHDFCRGNAMQFLSR